MCQVSFSSIRLNLCYNILMKTLFAAFGGRTNSSKALLDLIDCPPEDKLLLKNSFKSAPAALNDKLSSDAYDLAILFGQRKILRDRRKSNQTDKTLAALRLETVARDNRVAYHTEVNFPELVERLTTAGLDPIISKDAGRYLCNNLYFQALKYADEKPLRTKIIFIHIPKLRQNPDLEKIATVLVASLDDKLLLDPNYN